MTKTFQEIVAESVVDIVTDRVVTDIRRKAFNEGHILTLAEAELIELGALGGIIQTLKMLEEMKATNPGA